MYDSRANKWIFEDKVREKMIDEIKAITEATDVIGTSEELFDRLTNEVVRTNGNAFWPENADSFEHHLREVEGTLFSEGVSVLWMDYQILREIFDEKEIKLYCPGFKAYRQETAITVLTRHPGRYLSGN